MGLLGLPKKNLGSEGPTLYGTQDPQNASFRAFGGPESHRGWGPQTPKLFWEVLEVPIGPPEKIKWLVQLFHGFFEPNVIDRNC